jgi:hypothetical protein
MARLGLGYDFGLGLGLAKPSLQRVGQQHGVALEPQSAQHVHRILSHRQRGSIWPSGEEDEITAAGAPSGHFKERIGRLEVSQLKSRGPLGHRGSDSAELPRLM